MNGESFLEYDPETYVTKTLYTPENDDGIISFYVSGNTINYLLSPTANLEDGVKYTYTIPEEARLMGDIDGDGVITASDYILVKRMYMGTYAYDESDMSTIDVDGDGTLGTSDYIIVKRIYMGTYKVN
jgi:hypothetical protein